MLIEHFNTSNQSIPTYERHESFVQDIGIPDCNMVMTLPPDERCAFVTDTEYCQDDIFILDYTYFFYCSIDTSKIFVFLFGELVLICGSFLLFLILGSTTDGFFCPCLKVLCDILGLNENVAGVTLLAFGNCAPDMITGLTGLASQTRIIYTDVLGSAMFVTFFVGGVIMSLVPFVIQPTTFLRDTCFLLFDVVFLHYCFSSDLSVSLAEAIGITSIYLFYIFTVVFDQYLSRKRIKEQLRRNTEFVSSIHLLLSQAEEEEQEELPPEEEEEDVTGELFRQLFYSLNPIDVTDWLESGRMGKTVMLMKAPVLVFLKAVIPVVDYEIDGNGWSKLLNCIQIVLLPLLLIYAIVESGTLVSGVLYGVAAFTTIPLAVYVFKHTTVNEVPKYHRFLAAYAGIGSMFMIYNCAAEIVSILGVLGITTHRSSSFLGCTLLAWGNSVGDLVANISLSRNGYEKMGFAACFGGPLFTSLFGIGIAMMYSAGTSPDYATDKMKVGVGAMGETLNTFMVIMLSLLICAGFFTNFICRRSMGLFMISSYLIFVIFSILMEFQVIHPFGSEHRFQPPPESIG
ncbi:mitochondrial sodium/calcium exchanger protein-like [Glossina fuscipes]|uniref:Mitochondrial sodium/calcium exchanger protein-like n=1 Tax=Glossina fuscipes TaxID=7396 RepID=A0A9C6E287_9MUSC|nr:mitochondrial sodium/calcium exchanger protein-like [Glossina fuscipes]